MTPKPRKFADFRNPPIPEPGMTEEPIERVIMRLFSGSPDGLRVLGWMLSETAKCCPPNAEERALREAEGARRFVADIHATTAGKNSGG